MISNYIKIAFRNLLRKKVYTFINVFGLAIGLASVLLIAVYILNELKYDRFHDKAENIYRIEWHSANPQTRTPHPMAQSMVQDFPEVQNAVSLSPLWGPGLTKQTFSIRYLAKDIKFDEKNVLAVDSTFFDVFTFPLEIGNPKTALKQFGGILISSSTAYKYFGNENPMGKQLAVNNDTTILEVVGVFKDVPAHSHFHFDFLVSYELLKATSDPGSEYYTWRDFGHYNYIKLRPNTDVAGLEEKLMPWVAKYLDLDQQQFDQILASGDHFKLTPITEIHLRSNILWELEANGNISYIYILLAAAFLILLIACSNFINLTTARSAERAKEIGIRKTLGAFKQQLAAQFISESILLCLFSLLVAGLIVETLLPIFNSLFGFPLKNDLFTDPVKMFLVLGLTVGIGAFSGIYPALFLSSIKPGQILKGKFSSSQKGNILRKSIVVAQFTISMVLITSTMIIFNQLDYLQTRPLGFDKESVIVVPIHSQKLRRDFKTLKDELKKVKGVIDVTAVSNSPGFQFNQNPLYATNNPQQRIDVFQNYVDEDLLKVLDIPLKKGRFFSDDQDAEKNYFVINETTVDQLLLNDPIGSELTLELDGQNVKGTVIGVVSNFNFQSLHQSVRPLILLQRPYYSYALIKSQASEIAPLLKGVEEKWLAVNNDFEFQFSFLDDNLNSQYKAESRMGNIFAVFASIAIIIACLGLFGLAALSFNQRLKEVGVRKILGASLNSLLFTLNKEFAKLLLIAITIAIPFIWILMGEWLNNFTFRIGIDPISFFVGAAVLLAVAVISLSYLTFRAAGTNPVETLKE